MFLVWAVEKAALAALGHSQTPNPKPQTLNPQTPEHLNTQTLNPEPQTLNPKPQTLNPKPKTPNTKTQNTLTP